MAVESIFSRGKCRRFAEIWFTFPDRTNEECRQNDRRSDCLISSGSLSRKGRTRNAGRMAVEADCLISSRGKCRRFVVNWFTFPERTDEECRQNGRRSDCLISSPGKVPQIRGKLVHFPGINSENGGIINIFEGKVYRIRSKLVHFPLFHMRQTMSHKRNKQRPVNAPLRHIRPCGTSNTSGTSDSAEHQACETCG